MLFLFYLCDISFRIKNSLTVLKNKFLFDSRVCMIFEWGACSFSLHRSGFCTSNFITQILPSSVCSFFWFIRSTMKEMCDLHSCYCEFVNSLKSTKNRTCFQLFLISICIPYLNNYNKIGQTNFDGQFHQNPSVQLCWKAGT